MADAGRTREVMAGARRRGVIPTPDVFAATAADLPKVESLLPWADHFLPSEQEARPVGPARQPRSGAVSAGPGRGMRDLAHTGEFITTTPHRPMV